MTHSGYQDLLIQERRSIKKILDYTQKIVFDLRIPEYIRVFEFTKSIKNVLSKFNFKSSDLSELIEFRKNLEIVQSKIINKCQAFGIYDY